MPVYALDALQIARCLHYISRFLPSVFTEATPAVYASVRPNVPVFSWSREASAMVGARFECGGGHAMHTKAGINVGFHTPHARKSSIRRCSFEVPRIGTIHGLCASSEANRTGCVAFVQHRRGAIRMTRPTHGGATINASHPPVGFSAGRLDVG